MNVVSYLQSCACIPFLSEAKLILFIVVVGDDVRAASAACLLHSRMAQDSEEVWLRARDEAQFADRVFALILENFQADEVMSFGHAHLQNLHEMYWSLILASFPGKKKQFSVPFEMLVA